MPTPLMLGTDLTNITFTSSVGDNASFPATNLKTYVKSDKWKSANSNASQFIYANVGTDVRLRNGIGISNHNLNGIMASGTMKIQSAVDSAFSSGLTTHSSNFLPATDPYFLNFGGISALQYWRIFFDGTLNAVPEIGNLFFDEVLDFIYPYDSGYRFGTRRFKTAKSESLSGLIRTAQGYAGRKTFDISFDKPGVTDAVKTAFASFYNRVRGGLRPFYFMDDDGSINYVHFEVDEDPTQNRFYNLHSLKGLTMIAQEVG